MNRYEIQLYDSVTFKTQKTNKGVSAVDIQFVKRGHPPWIVYADEYPNKIMYSHDGAFPGGFKVIKEVGNVWSKAKGFTNARNASLSEAAKLGANAVIITRQWESHHSKTTTGGFINIIGLFSRPSVGKALYALSGHGIYRYRMVHIEGMSVVIARKKTTIEVMDITAWKAVLLNANQGS